MQLHDAQDFTLREITNSFPTDELLSSCLHYTSFYIPKSFLFIQQVVCVLFKVISLVSLNQLEIKYLPKSLFKQIFQVNSKRDLKDGEESPKPILQDKDFILDCLCWHNEYRARHSAPALTISPGVSKV